MNSAVPFWFASAAGGDGPVPPIPTPDIGRSLRFRGNQSLTRTPTVTQGNELYTYSAWVKNTEGTNDLVLVTGNRATTGSIREATQIVLSAGTARPWTLIWSDGTNGTSFKQWADPTNPAFRDPSAWYHIVFQYDFDNEDMRAWVNGVELDLQEFAAGPNWADLENAINFAGATQAIGAGFQRGETTPANPSEGYYADVFMIAGRTLPPTTFGRFNNNGIWIPRVAPANLRAVRIFSNQLTSDSGQFAANRGAQNMFNGNPGLVTETSPQGTPMTFRPVPTVEFDNLWVRSQGTNMQVSLNGGAAVALTANTITEVSATAGTLTTLEFTNSTGGTVRADSITINRGLDTETQLLDPFVWSAGISASSNNTYQADPANRTTNVNNPQNAFNGVNNNGAFTGSDNQYLYWVPPTPLTGVTQLGLGSAGGTINYNGLRINGVDTGLNFPNPGGNAIIDISEAIPADGEITEIAFFSSQGGNTQVNQFQVNNQIYINDVNPSYGANGFRLEFADPNDIGRDSSGNQNDFTPNNFDTNPVGIFSNFLFSSTTPLNINSTAQNIGISTGTQREASFDGNTNQWAASQSAADNWFIYRPTTALTDVTSIQFTGVESNAFTLNINGTNTGQTVTPPTRTTVNDITLPDDFDGTLTSIAFNNTTSSTAQNCFSQLIINGQVLVDNTGVDYDSMQDSPTQNWALFNGALAGGGTISAANLTLTATTGNFWVALASTILVSQGRWYWEIECLNNNQTVLGIGRADGDDPFDANVNDDFPGGAGDGQSIGLQSDGNLRSDGTQDTTYGNSYAAGDILSFALDMNSGTLWIGINGTWQGGATEAEIEAGTVTNSARTGMQGTWRPVVAAVSTGSCSANFGQKPFVHAVPEGYQALQTENLPAAPVTDGRDYFRVVQAGGAAIQACAQGEINDQHGSTGFASGLWWVKDITNDGTNHQLFDSVRGQDAAGDWQVLQSNTTAISGDYVEPAGNSVGWCWQAGGAIETNTSGTIASQVLANNDAGFSIVTYTGSGVASTVGHGLTKAPEYLIVKAADRTENWQVWCTGLAADFSANLNTNGQAEDFNCWNDLTPTDSVINLGVANGSNSSGNVYTAYCWTSISGYSAFGQYDGNDNDDGMFVHTGFTPSLVLFKATNTNGEWVIYDSTRNPSNPVDARLAANNANGQRTSTNMEVDLLSNGFKQRNQEVDLNNNFNYIYAAWGSSPFGGSNILPTPAALQSPQPTPADGRDGVVSNSLRFSGAGTDLTCPVVTTGARTWTWSAWVKKANPTGGGASLFSPRSGGISSFGLRFRLANTDNLAYQSGATTLTGPNSGDRLFRDPGAWYHIVCRCDFGTNLMTLYVNGEQVGAGATDNTAMAFDGNMKFSAANTTNGGDFYIADVYLVEQSLAPTAFGRYNDQDIWVPRLEAAITTTITNGGGYGDNGFKLIMNQSNITFGDTTLLQDQSGNNNDFTFVGPFELIDEDSEEFDLMVDGPSTNFATLNRLNTTGGDNGIAAGNLQNQDTNAGAASTWTGNISMRGGLYYFEITRFVADNGFNCGILPADIVITGGNIGLTESVWINQAGDLSDEGTTTNNFLPAIGQGDTLCVAFNADNGRVWFGRNGTFVGDPAAGTNPAATITVGTGWVPYTRAIGNTGLERLAINCGQQPFLFTVPNGYSSLQCRNLPAAPITDGRQQCRALYLFGGNNPATAGANQVLYTGVITNPAGYLENNDGNYFGLSQAFNGIDNTVPGGNIYFVPNNTDGQTTPAVTFDPPISGTTYVINASVNQGQMYINGVERAGNIANTTADITANVPAEGITSLGFDAAAAASDGFSVLTVDGNDIITRDILTQSRSTFPSGLWITKQVSRNATAQNWQFVDSVRGQDAGGDWQAVICPGPSSDVGPQADYDEFLGLGVAYCFNVDNAPVTNTAGTIQAQVAANQTAGFSIITYTGDTGATSVGHGLGQEPDFVLVKPLETTAATTNIPWQVYLGDGPRVNNGLGRNFFLNLNLDSVATNSANFWGAAADWDDETMGLNPLGTTMGNLDAAEIVAYAWTTISGYSSFGRYNGNGNTANNGPFIYCGFKPEIVWVKEATGSDSSDWVVFDSARNPFNGEMEIARFNQAAAQFEQANVNFDIVSNGFKVRCGGGTNTGGINNAASTYLYAAWASQPFGGSNVQPTTAR